MSDIQLGIKISADGSKPTLNQVAGATKGVGQDIASLNAGWAKLNDQFARQTAAKAWTDQLSQASAGAQRLKQSIDTTTQAARNQNRSLADSVNLWAKWGIGLMAAQQAWAKVNQLAQTADVYTNLNSRLKLVSGTTQELARAQAASFDTAQRYNMALDDTGRLYTRLAPIAQTLGRSQSDLITLMSGVGAAMKVSGATAAEAGSTITQLTQSLAAATVQGSDFNLLYDTAPAIVRAVEKELSGLVKQYGSLKNAMEKGAVSNQQLFDVLVKTSPEFQRQADTMQTTVGGALKNLSNAWTRYIGETDNANGASRDLASTIKSLADNFEDLADPVATVVSALARVEFGGWQTLYEYLQKIQALGMLGSPSTLDRGWVPPGKPTDEEERLMKMGRGELSIAEIAGPPPGAEDAQKSYFQSMADGAKLASGSLEKLGKMQTIIYATAIKYKLDPALMLGLAERESGFNPNIVNKKDGGRGLGQFMPGTWRQYQQQAGRSTDFNLAFDPVQNADNMARYLKDLSKAFHGDIKAMVSAYNAGERAVQKAIGRGADPSSVTTQGHTPTVLRNMRDWKAKLGDLKLEAGDVLDPNELAKATDDYYKFVETTLNQRERLEDAQSQTRLAKHKIELQTLQQQAEQAAKASERTIADVLQQQGLNAGLKAISEAQAQQERYLREAQAQAGGSDTEATRAAQQKLADIDALIAKTKELDRWDQQGADLQNQRAIAEQALAQARIAAGAQDLDLQKALSENQATYDAMRQQAIREQMQREIEAATTLEQRNAAIQRAITLEQQLGLASADSAKAAAELKQKEAAFIANINAELAYQTQLYAALQAAKAKGATPPQLEVIAKVSDQMRAAGQDVSADELAKLQPRLESLELIKQKNQELLGVNQQVREEQLRLNQAWQEATEQARLFAEQAGQAFGMLGDAIGRVVVGIAEYGQRAMQIQRDAKEAIESLKRTGKYSPEKEYQIMERAADKALGNQMGLWGDLTNAMSRFFKEGSDGYKAMTVMSQAFYAIKMGLAVKDAILQIASMAEIMMADTARTGVEVANAGSRAAAKGAEAIMNQGSGDPYSAIPRMIAMAAMVTTILAGFGIAIAGAVSGGGGTSAKVPDTDALQKKQGSGSVYGDAEAQSASLRNSLALLEDNSSADLDYTREMRDLLEHIDEGINGVANQLYATVRPPQLTEDMIKKGIEAVDYGIQGIQQTVGSIIKGGLQGQSYQTYKREVEKSSFNFMMPGMGGGEGEKVVKWVRTIFNDIDAGIAKQFGAVLGDVVKSLTMAADGLGVAGPDMIDKINKFVVDIGQVSLKDMNAQEMSDAIHAVISKISDDLARLTMLMLKPFRRAGEGFAETTTRVYEASIRAQASLKGIGVKIIELSDVADKTAEDLAAAITRESIARYENGSSIGEYIRTLQGTTDDVVEQYQELRRARNLFAASGSPDNTLGGDMIAGAGGLSKLMAGLDSYRENFLNSTEQLTAGWMDMADNFDAFGLKMPRTSKEFRALVEGIDTTTKAGRELKGAIIAMAPAFNELQSAMDDAMSALQDAYNTAKQQAKSLRDYLDSLKTGDSAAGSPMDRYRAAQQQYEDLLRRYNQGDTSVTPDMLQSAASTYLSLSKQIFAGTTQYASDVQRVESSLSGIAEKLDAQISKAAAQVPALESNTGAVNSLSAALASYTETMRRVGEIISGQKINGASIDDINAGNNSDDAAKKARDAKEQEAQAFEKRLAEMTRDLRYAREHGQDNKADKIKAEIEAYIAQIQASGVFSVAWDGKRHDVSYRAKGGYTTPGWTVVGEQGPELVNFTAPSRVYTAQQTREALSQTDDGKTFAALEAIKDEMRALVSTQSGANPAIIGELQALRARMEDLERHQRMKA